MRDMEIIGHRGARGLWPENTLDGFAATIALGIGTIELDVGLTADGVSVITHDPALNPDITRTADGAWLPAPGPLIRSLTAAQLNGYDVGRIRPGSETARRFPDQTPRDGAGIPSLAAVLAACPATRFFIEVKSHPDHPGRTFGPSEMVEALVRVIDAAGAAAHVVVQSFDWRCQRHLRRTRPDLRLAWLTRPMPDEEARLWWDGPAPSDFAGSVAAVLAAEGAETWTPEHGQIDAPALAQARAASLKVVPWTVNDPARMRRLAGLGVDGIITDRPDIAQKVLKPADAR